MNDTTQLLRHMLAVIAYRGGKVLRDAPVDFGDSRVQPNTRKAIEILSHINDVLQWGLTTVRGNQVWEENPPGEWQDQVDRFFTLLTQFDESLSNTDTLPCSSKKLVAGPLADSLTHIGQLSTLRKLAGSPVRGENYYLADIETGRVGPDQSPANREFD